MDTHQPVAIITGSGSGIGKAVAHQLAALGWRLVLNGRNESKLRDVALAIDAHDGVIVAGDIGDPAIPETLVSAAIDTFGMLDAVICNAGVAPLVPLAETTDTVLEQCFAVNTLGVARLIRASWGVFVKEQRGRIVCTSSMATVDPFPGFFAYAASKAAVESLVRSCVNEGREFGIEAYAVAPGAVDTPMLRSMFDESQMPASDCLSPEQVATTIVQCATGQRIGDIGRPIVMSATD